MESGRPMWRSYAWLVAAAVLLAFVLATALVGTDREVVVWASTAVTAAVIVSVLGWAMRRTRAQRSRYEEELAAWAAEQARQTERLRIAGDLHDLVSHGLGLVTVRAAVARRVTGAAAESERGEALADIEHVSRETTTELRRMLAVLRDPGAAPLRRVDTLDELPEIVRAANTAGLSATLTVGELGDVSPGVQLTICAVVRASLDNTIRHAGLTQAGVGVRRDGAEVVVDVQDAGPNGPWQPHPGAGHGLDGLRERVTALGGSLHAASDERGFRVTARIPDLDRP